MGPVDRFAPVGPVDLADVALSIVIWPNLIALLLLAPKVVEETRSYFERRPWDKRANGV